MRFSASLLLGTFLVVATVTSAFSQAVEKPLEPTQSGREYLSKLRLSGIQSDVSYYDPSAPAPELSTNERPRPEPDDQRTSWRIGNLEAPVQILTFALICGVAFLFWQAGKNSGLSLKRGLANPARKSKPGEAGMFGETEDITEFGEILQNPDRQAALIDLTNLMISRAVDANGLLLQRSWTVRDVLRRMPHDATWLPQLKELVLTGERVHFRDQAVSEDDFQGFANRARPILQELAT